LSLQIAIGGFIAELMSGQFLFFQTGQLVFVLLGAYGIWKIREGYVNGKGYDK